MKPIRSSKARIIRRSLEKRRAGNPFDSVHAEKYALPEDAPADFNNSYYFSGHSLEGESLFMRLGLRGDGACEVWFAYRKGQQFYSQPVELFAATACPLQVECLEVGKTWKVTYEGKMAPVCGAGSPLLARFEGIFTATAPMFDFFSDMNPGPMAQALAGEKWSRSFFEEVQKNNQVHYEQPGKLEGKLVLGSRAIDIDLHAIHDHSFGKRDWTYMNRHMWLLAVLGNGDTLNVSLVSYPAVRQIMVGNLVQEGKSTCVLYTQLQGDAICEGKGPDTLHLRCWLEGGHRLDVTVQRDAEVVYSFADGGYILREGLGAFTVNGRPGRGIVEFGFNKDDQRWR